MQKIEYDSINNHILAFTKHNEISLFGNLSCYEVACENSYLLGQECLAKNKSSFKINKN